MRNINFFYRLNTVKRTLSYNRYPLTYRHPLQTVGHVCAIRLISAGTEDIAEPSVGFVFKRAADERQGDLLQIVTPLKCTDADDEVVGVGIGHGDGRELVAHKGVCTDVDERFGRGEVTFKASVGKGVVINALNGAGLRNGQFVNLFTSVECEIGDLYDCIGQSDIIKAGTSVECALIDAAQLVILCKGDLCQIFAGCKGIVVDGDHACGHVHLGDGRAIECAITEGKDIGICKEVDLCQLAFLKRTKADDLDTCRNGEDSLSACRGNNELSAVLCDEQTVNRAVLRVICIYCKVLQIGERSKGVFPNVGYVCGNMNAFKSRMIEHVAHNHHALGVSKVNRFELLRLAERAMIKQSYAIGNGYSSDIRVRKGFLGNFVDADAVLECQRRDATVLKDGTTNRGQALGERDRTKRLGPLKCGLLHNAQFGVICKRKGLYRRISKCGTSDKINACGNADRFECRMVERFILDGNERFRQNNTLNSAISKRLTANVDDVATKVEFC